MNPDAVFVALFLAGVAVIVALWSHESAKAAGARLERLADPALTYAEAMAILDAPSDYPPGMLSGCWGHDPAAEAWWWRCSLCREFDHSLPAEAAAVAASAHECTTAALEAAKAEAKRHHPAYPERHRRNDDETGLFGGEYR